MYYGPGVWAVTPGPRLHPKLCIPVARDWAGDSLNASFQIVVGIVASLGGQYCVVFWESFSEHQARTCSAGILNLLDSLYSCVFS